MSRRAVVVCEREPYWTPELQRQFLGERVTVRGCRKWSELVTLSQEFETALRIVDFDFIAAECLAGMAHDAASVNRQPLLLLVTGERAEFEWPLRDGGADAVLSNRIAADELARYCRRWLA
jgi:hypothetical protein